MHEGDDSTWIARIASAQADHATVYVRTHRFDIGVPLHFDEQYERVSALEHVLAAFASDVVVGLRRMARRRRVEVDRVEAIVKGRLENPRTYLGVVGEHGSPAVERLELKVYVSSVEPPERIQAVWDETLDASPLVATFSRCAHLDLRHEIVI